MAARASFAIPPFPSIPHSTFRIPHSGGGAMLSIDLRGKRALVAGIADDGGYGFAIAKAVAEAGATVCAGTWPPALNIFLNLLERGKIDESRRLPDGSLLRLEKIYPLDAAYDTLADAPDEIRANKRYKDVGDFSVAGLAQRLVQDFGDRPLDIVVHSLANGPEVKKPLLDTSRAGYLTAVSVSAYSLVSLVARLGPLTRPGGSFLSLTYMASERVVPGYGGGMSSAKAALESDTRTLAFEAGRKYGLRVNTISAGPPPPPPPPAPAENEEKGGEYRPPTPPTPPPPNPQGHHPVTPPVHRTPPQAERRAVPRHAAEAQLVSGLSRQTLDPAVARSKGIRHRPARLRSQPPHQGFARARQLVGRWGVGEPREPPVRRAVRGELQAPHAPELHLVPVEGHEPLPRVARVPRVPATHVVGDQEGRRREAEVGQDGIGVLGE